MIAVFNQQRERPALKSVDNFRSPIVVGTIHRVAIGRVPIFIHRVGRVDIGRIPIAIGR